MRGLVLVLHNTGWDTSRERGSTVLPDACDTVLLLHGHAQGVRTLTHRKNRDGEFLESGLELAFRAVEGTSSGVIVPVVRTDSLAARLVQAVTENPGGTSTRYAEVLHAERTVVSRTLSDLQRGRQLRNMGTGAAGAWHPVQRDDADQTGEP